MIWKHKIIKCFTKEDNFIWFTENSTFINYLRYKIQVTYYYIGNGGTNLHIL